jgi:hypothetical protein
MYRQPVLYYIPAKNHQTTGNILAILCFFIYGYDIIDKLVKT